MSAPALTSPESSPTTTVSLNEPTSYTLKSCSERLVKTAQAVAKFSLKWLPSMVALAVVAWQMPVLATVGILSIGVVAGCALKEKEMIPFTSIGENITLSDRARHIGFAAMACMLPVTMPYSGFATIFFVGNFLGRQMEI